MKRLLIAIMAIMMLTGCSKDSMDTTYTLVLEDNVIHESRKLAWDSGFLDASVDMYFIEYYQGQRVAINVARNISDRESYTYTANPKTEYITVRYDSHLYDHYAMGDVDLTLYVATVFFLEKGKNTTIKFGPKTLTSTTEPK